MILKNKLTVFILITFLFSTNSFALTPQQYCQKLHSKSTTGESYELLNISETGATLDVPASSVCTAYKAALLLRKECRNGGFVITTFLTNCNSGM